MPNAVHLTDRHLEAELTARLGSPAERPAAIGASADRQAVELARQVVREPNSLFMEQLTEVSHG